MNILITGSSSGIGAGLAEYFAKRNHNICITYYSSRERGNKVFNQVSLLNKNGKHLISYLDVCNLNSVKKLSKKISLNWNKVDLIILNAGIDYALSFDEMLTKDFHAIFNTKVLGSFLIIKSFLSLLQKSNNSNLIYISASVGWKPDWNDPIYSSACAAINNVSKSLSIGYSKYKIRSNVICPGPIKTNLSYWKIIEKKNPNIWKQIKNSNPLKTLCKIDDVGSLIDYITQEGKFINGNIIYLNGGAHNI